MKRTLIILMIILSVTALKSQEILDNYENITEYNTDINNPYYAKVNDSIVKNDEVKRYTYQFMGEIIYPQTGVLFHFSDYRFDKTNWSMFRFGVHIFNNILINDKLSIGLGTGFEYTLFLDIGIPIFVDCRYYFNSPKNIKPFIDIGCGTIITMYGEHFTIFQDEFYLKRPGLYFNCSSGFMVKHFQFNAGINIITQENKNDSFNLKLDAVIKCGFNF